MAEKKIVPNLEAKSLERNAVYTFRRWLERFPQSTKREDKIDISSLLQGVTETGRPEKNNLSKKTSSGKWDPKHCIK